MKVVAATNLSGEKEDEERSIGGDQSQPGAAQAFYIFSRSNYKVAEAQSAAKHFVRKKSKWTVCSGFLVTHQCMFFLRLPSSCLLVVKRGMDKLFANLLKDMVGFKSCQK